MSGRAVTRSKALASAVNGNEQPVPTVETTVAVTVDVSTSERPTSLGKRARSQAAGPAKRASKKQKTKSHDNEDETTWETKADDPRPPCRGIPRVWAATRPALNETVDYFRSNQGGVQTNDGFCRGYMFARAGGVRPYMDAELIITRASGGMSGIDGELKQSKDQMPEQAAIKGFLANMEYNVTTPIILSDECRFSKAKPPHPYSMMGHFKSVYLWWEESNGCVVARTRFELLHPDGNSWWVPKGDWAGSATPDYTTKALRQMCPACHETHPHIYKQGFVCVKRTCKIFWTLNGKKLNDNDTLDYNPTFIAERTKWPAMKPPYSLVPKVLPPNEANDLVYSTMRAARKGIVCPQCHGCIQRKRMDGWFCETPSCGYTRPIPPPTLNIRIIEQSHGACFSGHPIPQHSFKDPFERRETIYDGPWRMETFDTVDGGIVKQIHSNEAINEQPGGPNDMLAQMLTSGLELARRPMIQSRVQGMLTNNFTNNFGMPYKFAANVPSTPFTKAPKIVMDALHRMIWAGTKASEKEPMLPLNEVLVLGYYKDQQIGMHSDGEKELGPTIVTFSLGAHAKMEIQMRDKYFYGASADDAKQYDPKQPIVDGCLEPETRREMNASWARWNDEERAKEFKEFKKLYKKRSPPTCFETELRHGDYIIMQGAALQQYFVHQIVNLGDIRFALTARHIKPDMLEKGNRDKRHYGDYVFSPEDAYTGNMDVFDHDDE